MPFRDREHATSMFPWFAAIILGALVPALIASGALANARILPIAFMVTLGYTLILGLPVALFYRARRWTRLSATLVGAFLIGAIPFGILTVSVNGIRWIIDDVRTLADWLDYLGSLAAFGALGASGGLVFWLTLKSCGVLAASDHEGAAPTPGARRIAAALTALATMASVAVAALPSVTMDRSCHNVFRDGRRSVPSSLNIDLDIAMEEWPAVTTVLENFAASHGMLFRDSSSSRPQVKVLGLSACTEQVVIDVIDQRWASRNYAPLLAGRGVPVWIYDLADGNEWRPLARELVAALDSQWPGKVRFRDGGGRLIPPPAALMPQAGSTQ
jgi:hypothetical protein